VEKLGFQCGSSRSFIALREVQVSIPPAGDGQDMAEIDVLLPGANHLNTNANRLGGDEVECVAVNGGGGGPEWRLSMWCSPAPCRPHRGGRR
jgi:hypothetical protein